MMLSTARTRRISPFAILIALTMLGTAHARLIKPTTPPRGWNSYDAFGASNESATLANAAVLAHGDAFKGIGKLIAWRVRLLDGDAVLAERRSFLWTQRKPAAAAKEPTVD